MINLLPDQIKTDYRYARRNVQVLHWINSLAIVLLGLILLEAFGWLTLHYSIDNYSKQVSLTTQQLQKQNVIQTQKTVKSMTDHLRLAVQVLSQEVLFSKLITQIGAAMPTGAILTGLTINQTSGGLNLAADTSNYTTASQVQVNLSDPINGIFAKVDIVNINCTQSATNDPTHPCTVQLRALFNTKNQFLFINQGTKK